MLKVFPALAAMTCVLASACSGGGTPPPSATLDSGVTSSNGGGQRAVGDLPGVGVSNGTATERTLPRDPRVPRY